MKQLFRLFILFVITFLISGCLSSTPYTHRKQLVLFSPAQEMQMGYQAARQILAHEPISRDPRLNEIVQRVGRRIAQAANQPNYKWQFFVIDKDVLNAFCLPGGKVFVYKGLFKAVQNDDQLAVVLGHEVAHAIARHGAERMSMVQLGRLGERVAERTIAGGKYAGVIKKAYGATEGVGLVLPFSRKFEYEADEIGLYLMTKAGYDPYQAIPFWENMMKLSQGRRKPPEFLSTHPADMNRIRKIKKEIPIALKNYR
ncbi:MAG: M48 family peptidase [Sulfurospirillum sp.]|nr:MAG: M48 family peptidase [Sulfurospirillum sp.]